MSQREHKPIHWIQVRKACEDLDGWVAGLVVEWSEQRCAVVLFDEGLVVFEGDGLGTETPLSIGDLVAVNEKWRLMAVPGRGQLIAVHADRGVFAMFGGRRRLAIHRARRLVEEN